MSTSDSNENSGASTSDPVKDTSQIMLTASLPHEGAHQDPHPHSGGKPIVYSALLSGVAEQFRSMITLSEKVKDGVTYQDAFDGQEAVDKLALIIRTKDRNLAVVRGGRSSPRDIRVVKTSTRKLTSAIEYNRGDYNQELAVSVHEFAAISADEDVACS
ncbi:RHO1 GDP-GTP exchange protein 2 [Tulasnella sp. 427]|nr:RHO1 GDP-GTP exchange protein 2 [Tulasnella sp. 427]